MHVVSRLPQMSSLVHSIALYTIAINTVAAFKVMTTSNHTHTQAACTKATHRLVYFKPDSIKSLSIAYHLSSHT